MPDYLHETSGSWAEEGSAKDQDTGNAEDGEGGGGRW